MDCALVVGNPETIPLATLKSRSVKQRLAILRFLAVASRNCAWMALKNRIKIIMGRRPYFDERGLFLWQYLLHLTGLRPIRKITCVGLRREGPGSQALMIMSAINFAFSSGLTYVHTPFSLIRHADRPMEEWAAAWEALLNLGAGEIVCEAERREAVSYCHNFPSLELCLGWSHRNNELSQNFKAMVPQFRRKYYLNKSPRTTKEVTVAVHFRRGFDVSANDYLWTNANSILRTIAAVKSILDAHRILHTISVYSEGNSADFAEICAPGFELSKYRVGHYSEGSSDDIGEGSRPSVESFVDIDALRAMQELIEADVLIMSKSSFCYCAALISDGIKIFEPESESMDSWLPRSEDGSFDCEAFERQLSSLIQNKVMVANFAVGLNRQSS
jgi:hypothetical protein